MEKKTKAKTIITLIIAAGLGVLLLMHLLTGQGPEQQSTFDKHDNHAETNIGDRAIEKNTDLKKEQLKIALSNTARRDRDTKDERIREDRPFGYSIEEAERRAERNKKIADVVWDRTQEVLDQMISEEFKDRDWRNRIEEFAEYLLEDDKFSGTSLLEVDCRTTLCKATLHHLDKESYVVFKEEGSTTGLWMEGNMFGTTNPLENGEIETIIYFTRNGEYYPFEDVQDRILAMTEQ